ncbi:hypothetical protein F4809DRAFT_123916 [Biscogniauxia mediterranea]|nr:hypothetical protein F4809DRAFT_123916 [Biscogniauxia mediterranea]
MIPIPANQLIPLTISASDFVISIHLWCLRLLIISQPGPQPALLSTTFFLSFLPIRLFDSQSPCSFYGLFTDSSSKSACQTRIAHLNHFSRSHLAACLLSRFLIPLMWFITMFSLSLSLSPFWIFNFRLPIFCSAQRSEIFTMVPPLSRGLFVLATGICYFEACTIQSISGLLEVLEQKGVRCSYC